MKIEYYENGQRVGEISTSLALSLIKEIKKNYHYHRTYTLIGSISIRGYHGIGSGVFVSVFIIVK